MLGSSRIRNFEILNAAHERAANHDLRDCPYTKACRPRFGGDLPPHAVAADRSALPAPAELLGICRRIDQPVRALGRLLDGAGANHALPALGHAWPRLRPGGAAGTGEMVA